MLRESPQVGFLHMNAVRALIGAGGPLEWPADVPWPLHTVVAELQRSGAARTLVVESLQVVPDAGVGLRVGGVDAAVYDMARVGELRLRNEGLFSSWQVDAGAVARFRRLLMTLTPAEAHALHRAGRRWAALVATSLKNLRTASASGTSTKSSDTPILRQLELSGRRY